VQKYFADASAKVISISFVLWFALWFALALLESMRQRHDEAFPHPIQMGAETPHLR